MPSLHPVRSLVNAEHMLHTLQGVEKGCLPLLHRCVVHVQEVQCAWLEAIWKRWGQAGSPWL